MRMKLSRRQAAISGKQDQQEQKRDRELVKPTNVIIAQTVKQPHVSRSNDNDDDGVPNDDVRCYYLQFKQQVMIIIMYTII